MSFPGHSQMQTPCEESCCLLRQVGSRSFTLMSPSFKCVCAQELKTSGAYVSGSEFLQSSPMESHMPREVLVLWVMLACHVSISLWAAFGIM